MSVCGICLRQAAKLLVVEVKLEKLCKLFIEEDELLVGFVDYIFVWLLILQKTTYLISVAQPEIKEM